MLHDIRYSKLKQENIIFGSTWETNPSVLGESPESDPSISNHVMMDNELVLLFALLN